MIIRHGLDMSKHQLSYGTISISFAVAKVVKVLDYARG